uniref:F-box domain-containing protein n=1 Tax=Chloropicon roscoffensis TaxID=1461544 RepID=A0A7S3FMW7_9CHLO
MVSTKKRRRRAESTDTEPAFKALRQENEELREERDRSREEVEGLKLSNAKLEAGCQTPQEKDKEVKLPTEVWAIIAKKLDKNDVCSFALVSKQLREAQVLAGRKLVTRPLRKNENGCFTFHFFTAAYFTEDWCAYWSRKFNVRYTDPKVIKCVLNVAARQGYVQVFKKYWSHRNSPIKWTMGR